MSTLNATNTIAQITVEPLDAKPGSNVVLTAIVLDDAGAPAAGVTVTWVKLSDQTPTDAVTDSSGYATLTVNSDVPASIAYAAYVDGDTSTVTLGEACFYDSTIPHVFVPNGMDGQLDKYDISEQVQVIIDAYPKAAPQDKLTFWWDNIHSFTKEIFNPESDFPVTIDISNHFPPACLANGTYKLFYQYSDTAGNGGASIPWLVNVTGGELPPTLPAPEFPEGSDGWINQQEASNGTPIKVAYNTIAANDKLTVTWQLADESLVQLVSVNIDYTVTADDVKQGYALVTVDAEYIPTVQRGSAQAWYMMDPANGGTKESSAVGKIGVDTIA